MQQPKEEQYTQETQEDSEGLWDTCTRCGWYGDAVEVGAGICVRCMEVQSPLPADLLDGERPSVLLDRFPHRNF